jgi:multiple sugar transport system substrate-binding protein
MPTRRRFLRLLGATSTLTISAAAFAACGGATPVPAATAPAAKVGATAAPTTASPTTSAAVAATTSVGATPTAPAPPKSVGKGTLVFQTPGVGAEGTAFAPSAVKFSQERGIKVDYVDAGLDFEKYAVQYASDSGGDVYEYETKQMPHYATLGAFLNLDPYVATSKVMKPADFFPTIWSKCLIQGHLYAAPEETTPVALYYNKDLLQEAGIPPLPTSWTDPSWDWDAFLTTAQKLTKPDKTQFGVTISTEFYYSLPWIWSNGGHVVNEAITEATFNTAGVIGGWQYLQDLRWKYNVWAQPSQKDSGFNVGGDAMFLSGPYAIPGLRAGAKVPWALAALPRGKAGVWTRDPSNCYTIWTGSKNKDEAFQFLEFLTGPEGQLILGQSARGIPARKSVATSKAFLGQSDVNWQVFLDAIPHDGVQPVTDVWPDMDSAIDKMLTPMWNNQITVNDFVTRLNPVIQALLDKAKVRRDLSGSYLPVGWKIPSV